MNLDDCHFRPLHLINVGYEAKVMLAEMKNLDEVRKVILKIPNKDRTLDQEEKIVKIINSQFPDLVSYLGKCKNALIYKYSPGYTDMFNFLDSVEDVNNKTIMINLIKALKNLHSLDIYHLDLKPENILINDDLNIIIIDYGFSQLKGETDLKSCGTPGYTAPEILARYGFEFENSEITEKADIFSLGVIFFYLLNFYWPYDGSENDEYTSNILNTQPKFYYPQPTYLKKIVLEMLDVIPSERPSLDEILTVIERMP